jgi:protein O-mannosyl-transferase
LYNRKRLLCDGRAIRGREYMAKRNWKRTRSAWVPQPAEAIPKSQPRRTSLLAGSAIVLCLFLTVFVILVFLPTLRNGFANFDDSVYVYGNAHVQGGVTWESIRWAFTNLEAGFWHPLTWLSIMLDCQLFGLRAWGHHLTSVLLHAANTSLLFLLFRRMTGATWRSFVVAALFGLHPLHVEPVAWAAARKDVLSTLFWLLTMLMYVRHAEKSGGSNQWSVTSNQTSRARAAGNGLRTTDQATLITDPRSLFYILSLLCFACGLMSKTMVVTLPFILLLLDWWPLQRFQLKTQDSRLKTLRALILEKLPFLAAALGGGLLTVLAEKGIGAVAATTHFPISDRIGNSVLSYVRYLAQTAWPYDLAVFYPYPKTLSLGLVAGAALLLLLVSAFTWRASRSRPWLAFGWVWYLVTLLPVIGLIQVGSHAHADRYTYVPLIGIFLVIVWGMHDAARRWRLPLSAWATGTIILIGLCILFTRRQIGFWKDSEALFRHAIAVTGDNALACNNLGTALVSQGKLDEAVSVLRKAERLSPDDASVQDNLGAALARLGQLDEAIIHLRKAIRLNPAHAGAHNDLGAALGQQGRLDEAIEQLQLAVKLAPGDAGAHCNLGDALASKDRLDEAISQYKEAVTLKSDYPEAYCNLGIALARKGHLDEAIGRFQEALGLKPDFPNAQNNLRAVLELKATAATPPAASTKP